MTASPKNVAGAPRPIILCALGFELKVLARLGLGRRCDLRCCGPGPDALDAWAHGLGASDRPVILAGLAGALRDGIAAGSAHVITCVRDEHDDPERFWRPPLRGAAGEGGERESCTVVSCRSLVITADARRALAQRTGADLVDLESAAFAAAASSLSWRWGVIRGVSDEASSDLPEGLAQWIDGRGRSRADRFLLAACRRPSVLGAALRLRRNGIAAMRGVGARIEELLISVDAG